MGMAIQSDLALSVKALAFSRVCLSTCRPSYIAMSASSEKRRRVIENIGVVRGCTKTGVAELLSRLHDEGALGYGIADCSSSALKKRLHKPIDDLRSVQTPHGPLFKHIYIGAPRLSSIEIVNPMAHLHHLVQASNDFANLLVDASGG